MVKSENYSTPRIVSDANTRTLLFEESASSVRIFKLLITIVAMLS